MWILDEFGESAINLSHADYITPKYNKDTNCWDVFVVINGAEYYLDTGGTAYSPNDPEYRGHDIAVEIIQALVKNLNQRKREERVNDSERFSSASF